MANNSDRGKYWPYMILGFLAIGITLGFWTVKHAIKAPVHEANEYMLKYQTAETDINQIIEAQKRFDSRYNLELIGMKKSDFKPVHLKRKPGLIVALNEKNDIAYKVTDKSGNPVTDANVTLLLTRPFTAKQDQMFKNIKSDSEGIYRVKNVKLPEPGRYILRVRVQKGDAVGFKDTAGYWKPQTK